MTAVKQWVLWDIAKLVPYAKNVKKHDEKQVARLAESIQRFGWRGNPIIVDKHGVIIAGHGRRLAALKIGMLKVPVIVEDDMSVDQARAFRLADNRAAISDIDTEILKEELLDFDGYEELLDGIFDSKELDFVVADLGVMNEGIFDDDLTSVMDDTQQSTNQKIEDSGNKRVPISKVLGFKDFKGSDLIYVNRFMAGIQSKYSADGEEAFVKFVKDSVEL